MEITIKGFENVIGIQVNMVEEEVSKVELLSSTLSENFTEQNVLDQFKEITEKIISKDLINKYLARDICEDRYMEAVMQGGSYLLALQVKTFGKKLSANYDVAGKLSSLGSAELERYKEGPITYINDIAYLVTLHLLEWIKDKKKKASTVNLMVLPVLAALAVAGENKNKEQFNAVSIALELVLAAIRFENNIVKSKLTEAEKQQFVVNSTVEFECELQELKETILILLTGRVLLADIDKSRKSSWEKVSIWSKK